MIKKSKRALSPKSTAKDELPNLKSWHNRGDLFTPPVGELQKLFDTLPEILNSIWPLTTQQKKDLPSSILSLSKILTSNRSELRTPYWHIPAFCSAYLYYFLPWNLIRLCSILPNLPIPKPEKKEERVPLLFDAGSGPLTFPIALWMANPAWRDLPLKIIAIDAVRKPLELGQDIIKKLMSNFNPPVWEIKTATAPIHHLPRYIPSPNGSHYIWLTAAINILNELKYHPKRYGCAEDDDEELDNLDNLLTSWEPLWQNAPLLFIEPGTRLGGTKIMRLRKIAMELGLYPASPCTHASPCPLLHSQKSLYSRSWCHFTFSALNAPEWLKQLSKAAGLYKTSLTLSPIYLTHNTSTCTQKGLPCRVISRAFTTPMGESHYGCLSIGLGLLANSPRLYSGSLCLAKKPENGDPKDSKSHAFVLKPI